MLRPHSPPSWSRRSQLDDPVHRLPRAPALASEAGGSRAGHLRIQCRLGYVWGMMQGTAGDNSGIERLVVLWL